MSENKKNFFVGIISSGIIFFMGVLYLTIPAYYGIDNMVEIDTNNLLISMMLVYSLVKFADYILLGNNPTKEAVLMSIVASTTGIANVLLEFVVSDSLALAISLIIFVLFSCAVNLFSIDYYHDKKDAYYYVETMTTIILFIVGFVLSINLFNDSVVQTMGMGYLFIIVSILEAVDVAMKCMLKSKRFIRKVKLK